jgi:Uncharacterized protein conserved in bacteria
MRTFLLGGIHLPKQSMPVKEAARIAEKIAAELSVELVDTELVKEPTGHFLRFYIDREDGISVNELENFHRRILPLVENVAYDFLEVSSPGADRPLKTEKDFEKNAGLAVELKTYRNVNGAKLFTGDLVGLVDGKIVIRVGEGEEMAFERKDVAVVKPLIDFDEEDLKDET